MQYMSENGDLLEAAYEKMNLGRLHESLQYQLQLQQNLIHLATHADDDPRLQKLAFRAPSHQAPAASPAGEQSNGNDALPGGIGGDSELDSMIERARLRRDRPN